MIRVEDWDKLSNATITAISTIRVLGVGEPGIGWWYTLPRGGTAQAPIGAVLVEADLQPDEVELGVEHGWIERVEEGSK
jgi:hypothetical protein